MNAVDLFAGTGGSSEGARQAGVRVLFAANHMPEAVEYHTRNHPETAHACQDLRQFDFSRVPDHDIALCSPECTGHTAARGLERKHHDASRATAWAVVSLAEAKRPPAIVVENVPEFLSWLLFPAWRLALETLGYKLAPHILNAADHGVPTSRERAYIVCTRSSSPIDLRADLPRRARVSFASIMDETADDASTWTPTRELCAATRRRIARGRRTYPRGRFLVRYNGSAVGGLPVSEPIGSLTTRDRFSIIDADHDTARILTVAEYRRAMGFPESYVLPANKKLAKLMLGNAVCPPVMADILRALQRRI